MEIDELLKNAGWRDTLEELNVIVKEDGDFVLLKYEILADFRNPLVNQCRGVIFKKTGDGYKCVSRPFDKFFNFQETYAAPIDWSTARVQEKIDGSICKVWFDGEWRWSTNNTIDADKAMIDGVGSFGDVIRKADNYADIRWDLMDPANTYIFELISPYNQVIIKYDTPHLYHIGTRNNATGEEFVTDIGIEKPREFPLKSLEDCIKAAEALNPDGLKQEGFVVVDAEFRRIKIKSPKYIMYHHVWSNGSVLPDRIIALVRAGEMRNAMQEFPRLSEALLEWNAKMAIFEYECEVIMNSARRYYAEFDFDRKATAAEIKKMKFPFVGFWALDKEGCAKDLIDTLTVNKYTKLLESIELE